MTSLSVGVFSGYHRFDWSHKGLQKLRYLNHVLHSVEIPGGGAISEFTLYYCDVHHGIAGRITVGTSVNGVLDLTKGPSHPEIEQGGIWNIGGAMNPYLLERGEMKDAMLNASRLAGEFYIELCDPQQGDANDTLRYTQEPLCIVRNFNIVLSKNPLRLMFAS